MFDIGFFELLLIGVVTLLVVGPERLPKIARTAGRWMGKARHFVGAVKSEIDREIAADNLKKQLELQAGMQEFQEIVDETRTTGTGIKSFVEETAAEAGAPRREADAAPPPPGVMSPPPPGHEPKA